MAGQVGDGFRTGLWRKTGKNGDFFTYIDKDTQLQFFVEENKDKKSENDPDFKLNIREARPREAGPQTDKPAYKPSAPAAGTAQPAGGFRKSYTKK